MLSALPISDAAGIVVSPRPIGSLRPVWLIVTKTQRAFQVPLKYAIRQHPKKDKFVS
jgi:hypothetical protein